MTGACACKCIIQILLGFFKDKFIDGDFDGDDRAFVVETLRKKARELRAKLKDKDKDKDKQKAAAAAAPALGAVPLMDAE